VLAAGKEEKTTGTFVVFFTVGFEPLMCEDLKQSCTRGGKKKKSLHKKLEFAGSGVLGEGKGFPKFPGGARGT